MTIVGKVKRKLRWINIKHNPTYRNSDNIIEASLDERYAQYYTKKYQGFLDNLPTYTDTHQYSNRVWWCWLQGEKEAPDLCKACLKSVRKHLKDREIIIITNENFADYIQLPDYIIKKYQSGAISPTHFSDILRISLLIEHGGTWIDSSVFVTDFDKNLYDKDLFMFKNILKENSSIISSNWFITAEKNNPILRATQDLLFDYWRHNDSVDRYFIFHIFLTLAAKKYPQSWKKVPTFSNIPPHILQFEITDKYTSERFTQIRSMSSVHKLTQKADLSKAPKDSFYRKIIEGKLDD